MMEIEYTGFTPRQAFKDEVALQIDRLLAECPSDAVARVRAIFEPDRFVVEIAVHSSQGRFRSAVGVPIPKRNARNRLWQKGALEEMRFEVGRQIAKWRSVRFESAAA